MTDSPYLHVQRGEGNVSFFGPVPLGSGKPSTRENQVRLDFQALLEIIAAQEATLILPYFDANMAFAIGSHIRDAALAMEAALTIEVVAHDQQIFRVAMEGSTPTNFDYARRKRNLTNLHQRSSYALAIEAELGRNVVERMALNPRDYGLYGGCVPIRVAGAGMIGTVTVSGLPQHEDHRLVVEALAAQADIDLSDLIATL
jgi:uncharacterized protein (UPF0303 family)